MIKRIINEKEAAICDELLTKLIRDESKYDKLISQDFKVYDYFKNIIKDNKNILLGYVIDNQIIGYTFLKYMPEDNNKVYLIDGLYIEEAYRRKGYAKELLEYAFKLLEKETCDFVDINVIYANEIAKKLYKSLGFKEFKITMRKSNN